MGSKKSYKINIVSRLTGVGLDQDAKIIEKILREYGYQVNFSHHRSIKSLWRFFQRSKRYDLNIFLERSFLCWYGLAKKNVLIPNQERFPRRYLYKLNSIDRVLCKSRHAAEIFSALGFTAHFIGFTSKDKSHSEFEKSYDTFFHLAGKSTVKGTELILDLWQKHPEWPKLTVLQHPDNAPMRVPNNVNLIARSVSDSELLDLVNQHGIHLCPSRSEGWGHYIVEGMSCSAVVVTTNAPPMNELVDESRGVLVDFKESLPRHLGMNFFVDVDSLEQCINTLISNDVTMLKDMGRSAREWYLNNDQLFKERFVNEISGLLLDKKT